MSLYVLDTDTLPRFRNNKSDTANARISTVNSGMILAFLSTTLWMNCWIPPGRGG